MATRLTWLARAGWLLEQPLFWGSVATALAVKGGTRGRHAALRGSVCYLVAAFIANIVIKPPVYRRRPQGAGEGRITPVTSSFPSGHTASDSAFVFGVAQELPLLAVSLAAAATTAHWSLIRSEKHRISDVLAGGAIGLGVAYIMRKSWPPDTPQLRWPPASARSGGHRTEIGQAMVDVATIGLIQERSGRRRETLVDHPVARRPTRCRSPSCAGRRRPAVHPRPPAHPCRAAPGPWGMCRDGGRGAGHAHRATARYLPPRTARHNSNASDPGPTTSQLPRLYRAGLPLGSPRTRPADRRVTAAPRRPGDPRRSAPTASH